jgi:sugar/nucleoside kinase (ribokinase family)
MQAPYDFVVSAPLFIVHRSSFIIGQKVIMFVIIGTSTVDFFISGLDQIPSLGGDEFTSSNIAFCNEALAMVPGGNGGNCAYALGKLGAAVRLCSAVGDDRLGRTLVEWQTAAGVDLTGLLRSQTSATSTTTVITDQALNRLAFHHPGATNIFSLNDIPENVFNQATVVLLTSYSLLSAWRPEGAAQALDLARRNGTLTALDIGPAIGNPVKLAEITPLLPQVDYFLCNAHELGASTGVDDLETGMARILEAGAGWAIIKLGPLGAAIRKAGSARSETVPGFKVEARFTVGAGDSFNAGFLFGLGQGWDVAQAVRFGNATAALVVSAARGVLGAPTRAQVEALMRG